jgi:hypothetical protein
MFEKAGDKPVKIPFSTHEKAIAFRVELYKYRYAVRDGLPRTRSFYHKLMKVELSVKSKVLTLKPKKATFVEKLNEH